MNVSPKTTGSRPRIGTTLLVSVLVIVTFGALIVFGASTGVLGALLGLNPKSPETVLDEATAQRSDELLDAALRQIADTRGEGATSATELNETLRVEHSASSDLNSDGTEDAMRVISVQDAGSRLYIALAAVSVEGADPKVLPSTFLGSDLAIDAIKAAGESVTITGAAAGPASATKPADPKHLRRMGFTQQLRVVDGQLNVETASDGKAQAQGDEIIAEPPLELAASSRTDHPKEHLTGALRFGQLAVVHAQIPETHTLNIGDTSKSRATVTVVDAAGEPCQVSDSGDVDCTGDVEIVIASENAAVAEYDLTVEIIPDPLPPAPSEDGSLPAYDEQGRPIAYFTFDDGPSQFTPQILDILRRHEASGTFFMLGSEAQANPELVDRVRREGHAVGNHSWSHPDFTTLDDKKVTQQITKTDSVIGEAKCVRPPYGATNDQVRARIAELGKSQQLWTIDTLDWSRPGVAKIEQNIMDPMAPGAVVLMHDGGGSREQSVAALERVLTKLDEAGYVVRALPNCF